jgi:Flp pilus assembly protein TadD
MAHYSEAVRIKPDFLEAYNNLGIALASQGRIDEAITQYTDALRIKPDFLEARLNLGIALARQGRVDEAIRQYSVALRIKPDSAQARRLLNDLMNRAKSPNSAGPEPADR